MLHGKAYLKRMIAERVDLDPADLPFDRDVLAFLEAERAAGCRIVLATGADERIAQRIADYSGIFDEVLASDGKTNLTAGRKTRALTDRFGVHGFRYAGNSRADLPVWRQASSAIVCGTGESLTRRLQREGVVTDRDFTQPAARSFSWRRHYAFISGLRISSSGFRSCSLIASANRCCG